MHTKSLKIKETFNSAVQNHQKNNFQVAENLYREIIKVQPDHFESIFLLGTLLAQTEKLNEAKEMLIKSTEIKPNNVDALNNLGNTLKKLGELQKAINCYQKVIEIQPNYAYTHNNLGAAFKELGEPQKAINCYQKAIKLQPSYVAAHKNLMQVLEKTNHENELKHAISNAHALIKDNPIINLYEGILFSRNEKFNEAKNCLESITFGSKELNSETLRVTVLAKCYDRIADHDKAFNYFLKANNLFPQSTDAQSYDKNRFLQKINIRRNFFKKTKVNKWPSLKSSGKKLDPIFLIGFPRSGTTLLDTILNSHPMIEVIEEKNIMGKSISLMNELPNGELEGLKNMQDDQIKKVRNVYFDTRELLVQNKDKSQLVIDKYPLNIVYVGEIVRIFPNAKFIISLRHPCDCVLSCFMQNFKLNDAMANFLNLDDSAHFYDAVMSLWTEYKSIFSINFHEVKYENLIENLEPTVKSILDFLELPWDNSVIEYTKTAKSKKRIRTPSYNQVIKPIYTHAKGRWKNYKKQISNIYPILEPWIKKLNY